MRDALALSVGECAVGCGCGFADDGGSFGLA